MSVSHQAHPPEGAQEKLSWFALRFERWNELGEKVGLLPVHLEDLSGALGSAAVAFVESEERPGPAREGVLLRAVEELDRAGARALDAVAAFAAADPAPKEVLERALLLEAAADDASPAQ